jgi:hypothetical protein
MTKLRAGWAAFAVCHHRQGLCCGLPPFLAVVASHPMGSCLSTESAVAESRENAAASPPAPRETDKNKSLLPETQAEPAKQLNPTSEPPRKRDEEDEEDEGLGYDHAPIEEVCVFVRALFSDIFVTRGYDFRVFFCRLYALVPVSTLQHFVAGVSSENFQSLCKTRVRTIRALRRYCTSRLSFYHCK